jgi:hypothetical protein
MDSWSDGWVTNSWKFKAKANIFPFFEQHTRIFFVVVTLDYQINIRILGITVIVSLQRQINRENTKSPLSKAPHNDQQVQEPRQWLSHCSAVCYTQHSYLFFWFDDYLFHCNLKTTIKKYFTSYLKLLLMNILYPLCNCYICHIVSVTEIFSYIQLWRSCRIYLAKNGILPFSKWNWFASAFMPMFKLLILLIRKDVWREVIIWFKPLNFWISSKESKNLHLNLSGQYWLSNHTNVQHWAAGMLTPVNISIVEFRIFSD